MTTRNSKSWVLTLGDRPSRRGCSWTPRARQCVAYGLIASLVCGFATVAKAQPTRQKLTDLYERIEADQKLSIADKYEAQMRVFKASLEAGNAYTEVFDKVQKYSLIAGDVGGLFRPEVAKAMYQFSERLETASQNQVFEKFGAIVKAEGYVSDSVKLISDIDKISRDPNLPPSARRSLGALRAAGEAMEKASWVPLAGPVLETYGKCTKELTSAVSKTAENIVALKGGGFSLTEEKETLAGLEPGDYERTPLFDKGIPLVRKHLENDKDRVYLQVEPGRWTEVTRHFDYDQVANIVADYQFLNDGRPPTPREIVHYLARPESREDLATRALDHAELRINQALLKEVSPELDSKTDYKAFLDAKEALQEKLGGLGLVIPPGSAIFRELLRAEIKKPGTRDADLRRIAMNTTPHAREYLRFKGISDPDRIPLERLTELLRGYREGSQREFVKWMAAHADVGKSASAGNTASTMKTGEQPKPKDEQTEKLERRAKELAEKGLKPRDPNEKPDPNEARPIVPEDCTIEVAFSDATSGKTNVDTYKILGNTVMNMREPFVKPARQGPGYWDAEERYVDTFAGSLNDNVITGRWVSTTATEGKRYKDKSNSRLDQHAKGTVKNTADIRMVLFGDGTVSWEYESKTEVRLHALVGVFNADTGSTESFHTTPSPKRTGAGTWQIRKSGKGPSPARLE
ncbi:MAG: hypothetical protein NTW96_18805 [Planctomycetia bacterium]|nr:hypothetical protein [Planctomycetia bacterium]